MSDPLLTVGIPTLNGERFVRETLESVLAQLPADGSVEIVLLDNASSDSTGDIAWQSGSRTPFFRYARNPTTLEVKDNIRRLAEIAEGEYLWLLADDDVLTQGALDQVLRALVTHGPALLLTGFVDVDVNLEPLGPPPRGPALEVVLPEPDQALLSSGFRFGLISAIVVRRQDFLEESARATPVPSGFDFLYVVPMVMRKGSTIVLPGTQVLFRKYPKRWVVRNDYHQTIDNYYLVIPLVLKRLGRSGFRWTTISRMQQRNLRAFALHVLIGKAKGLRFDRALVGRLIAANWTQPLFWLQAPVLLVPGVLPRMGIRVLRTG